MFMISPINNSPHLRKSGGRPVFFDLGDEPANGAGDGSLLNALETNETKSGGALRLPPRPSPVLLWRFKIGWDSVMRMSADLRDLFLYEAFLYYNPLLLLSAVSYAKNFDLDQNHLTHRETWKIATWMTILVPASMTAYLCFYSLGEVSLAASQPV